MFFLDKISAYMQSSSSHNKSHNLPSRIPIPQCHACSRVILHKENCVGLPILQRWVGLEMAGACNPRIESEKKKKKDSHVRLFLAGRMQRNAQKKKKKKRENVQQKTEKRKRKKRKENPRRGCGGSVLVTPFFSSSCSSRQRNRKKSALDQSSPTDLFLHSPLIG